MIIFFQKKYGYDYMYIHLPYGSYVYNFVWDGKIINTL